MRLASECYQCILTRSEKILDRAGLGKDLANKIYLEVERGIQLEMTDSWVDGGVCPAQLGSIRQKILESHQLGATYHQEKILGENMGRKLYANYDGCGFERSLELSLLGNGIEFDVGGKYKDISGELESFLPAIEKMSEMGEIISKIKKLSPGKVIFLFDNVGEHLIDAHLIENFIAHGWEVEGVVKGASVLNDVTIDDVKDYPVDIKFHHTNSSNVGLFLSQVQDDLKQIIMGADLIIIKGMAQFETLSREILLPPSLYLLRAKCDPVALAIGVKKGDFFAQLVPANSSLL
ncbi:MAG: DUF89 family protein [Candidatus Heimdallarchaeota archaeon]|nr:DUF89 family protein [Candidatus Heimdallarchaeota archaeon]